MHPVRRKEGHAAADPPVCSGSAVQCGKGTESDGGDSSGGVAALLFTRPSRPSQPHGSTARHACGWRDSTSGGSEAAARRRAPPAHHSTGPPHSHDSTAHIEQPLDNCWHTTRRNAHTAKRQATQDPPVPDPVATASVILPFALQPQLQLLSAVCEGGLISTESNRYMLRV